MDDATFKLGHDRSEAGHLVSRKNDIRFDVAITPCPAPWGRTRGDTVYFTDPLSTLTFDFPISILL